MHYNIAFMQNRRYGQPLALSLVHALDWVIALIRIVSCAQVDILDWNFCSLGLSPVGSMCRRPFPEGAAVTNG